MIVTLRAGDVCTQECRQCVREAIQRHARVTQEPSGRTVFTQTPFSRQQFVDNFVPRTILSELILEPCLESVCFADPIILILHTQHVAKPIVHVRDVPVRCQQLVDQACPSIFVSTCVKRGKFRRCWNTSNHVEIDTPYKLRVVDSRIRSLLVLLQITPHNVVDSLG